MIECKLMRLNRLILSVEGSPHYAADATDLGSDNIPQPSNINFPSSFDISLLLLVLFPFLLLDVPLFPHSPNFPPAHPLA